MNAADHEASYSLVDKPAKRLTHVGLSSYRSTSTVLATRQGGQA